MREMTHRNVLIAGGGSGIGRACAHALAAAGANVVIADPGVSVGGQAEPDDPAARVADDIRRLGGSAVGLRMGIGDVADGERLVAACTEKAGALDALVVPAVVLREGDVDVLDQDDWDAVLRVGLTGVFGLLRAAVPGMKARGRGRVVTFTSRSGLEGRPGAANYAATKMGIVGLTRSVANELAPYGIAANCIAPRAHTRASDHVVRRMLDPAAATDRLATIGAPEDVAPLAVHLASEACQVTGRVFWCAGGELAEYPQPVPITLVAQDGPLTVEDVAAAVSGNAGSIDRGALDRAV